MEYALHIARKTGASVLALHVIFPNQETHTSGVFAQWFDEYLKQRKVDTNQWALDFKKKARFSDLSISSSAVMGFPVSTIIDTAESQDFDLIVMGTTGTTGIVTNILGGVTAGVIGHTSVPILNIPPKAKFRASRPYVFATDFRVNLNPQSLKTLETITGLQKPKVKVLHVRKNASSKPDLQAEVRFQEKMGTLKTDFNYLSDDNIPRAVGTFIEATDAAGLITVSHEHTLFYKLFHQSISKTLVGRNHVPVLILQDAQLKSSNMKIK